MHTSVIIPTLNEAGSIAAVIKGVNQEVVREIIVVDGGSVDNTPAVAEQEGALVLHAQPGRAYQLNRGAEKANGDILLFLHGDTFIPAGFDTLITKTLQQPGVAGGAFSLAIENGSTALKSVAFLANLRSRIFQLPYGDQALFTTKTTFDMIGGFPQLPIMEDYQFVCNLRKQGKVVTLKQTVTTSGRRWKNMGVLRTTAINQLIVLGYHLGIPPAHLVKLYQRAKGIGETNHA